MKIERKCKTATRPDINGNTVEMLRWGHMMTIESKEIQVANCPTRINGEWFTPVSAAAQICLSKEWDELDR